MSDVLDTNNPLLSSKEAGKMLGYTHDYISKLCREGKMQGVQKGRAWYVTQDEIIAFKERHEQELAEKKAELSQKFSEIRLKYEAERNNEKKENIIKSNKISVAKVPIKKPKTKKEPAVHALEIKDTKQDSYDSYKRDTSFVMPKQFIAVAVLALVLMIPTLMGNINTSSKSTASSVFALDSSSRAAQLVDHFNTGVATVIEAQSQVVEKTVQTYQFMAYLNDGYWELAASFKALSGGLYDFLDTITQGHLTVYLIQGQIIYQSLLQTQSIGYAILNGYELLGKSLVVGSANVVDSYQKVFNINVDFENPKKKLDNFSINTQEGFAYAKEQTRYTLTSLLFEGVTKAFVAIGSNVQNNTVLMLNAFKNATGILTASVVDVFSFDFGIQEEGVIRVDSE